jgi:hypothetical protein
MPNYSGYYPEGGEKGKVIERKQFYPTKIYASNASV